VNVTISQQKINVITQIVLSLKNIAQEKSVQLHIVKQNKQQGDSCCFFVTQKGVILMDEKKIIRSQMKETLSMLSKPLYEDYSYQVAGNLFQEPNWKAAKVIGITISKQPEVDTYQIIRKAWETGKQVVVPKCIPTEKALIFRTLTRFAQLESVFYGLLEPIEAETTAVKQSEIDLLIVPGLAYTSEGFRVGFGGGYYDRYLNQYQGNTVALAFQCQVVPSIPVEAHDIPVSKIITEHEVIKTI
jgi:5-formyltetrahydrofolate cyclo-ligase